MAVTLNTIRTQVRSNIDEANSSDWADAEIDRAINQRYHRLYTAVLTVYEDYKVSTTLLTTVADQQEYDLPSDLFKVRRVEINYDISNSNSTFQRVLPISNIDGIRTRLGETNLSGAIRRNPGYYIIGSKIGFLPIPDKNGTNAIKVWYAPVLEDLEENEDTIDIPYPERYYSVISDGATGDMLRFGAQDSIEADKYDQKYAAGLLLMQEELEDRIAEEAKMIIDTSGDDLDFGGGWW